MTGGPGLQMKLRKLSVRHSLEVLLENVGTAVLSDSVMNHMERQASCTGCCALSFPL